jgi:hypothetical protein
MSKFVTVAIPVEEETARHLAADVRRAEAVGRLVDCMVRPAGADDPLAAVLEASARAAERAGLIDAEIDAELAARKAERRSG